jgi:hypothetical protein
MKAFCPYKKKSLTCSHYQFSMLKHIKIRREVGHHTHYIGRLTDGRQFMAFIVAAPPLKNGKHQGSEMKWYAVVHLFDDEGRHLKTEALFFGNKEVCGGVESS